MVRLSYDLEFLNECRRNNVIPIFLQFNVANQMLLYSNAYKKCQQILLKEEISLKKNKIKYLSKLKENAYNELVNNFPPNVITIINEIISALQIREQRTKYFTHHKKLNGLILKRNNQQQQRQYYRYTFFNTNFSNDTSNTTDNNNNKKEKLVWNLSSRKLNKEEINILEKGLTYNRASKLNHSQVISNVEYLFHRSSGVQKQAIDYKKWDEEPDNILKKELRTLEPKQLSFAADLKNATQKFFHQANTSLKIRRNKNLNEKNEENVLSKLSKDSSILITKPDKGRGVVVLDRNDYINKLETILSDSSKFKLLNQDPTISRENSLTNLLLQIKNEEYLTQQEYKYIKPVGSIPARLYGLPKVHKSEINVPLRPIVSCVQSYNYRLGKYLANIIKSIRNSNYSLKNNTDFLAFLRHNSDLLKNNKMISFDVESLFTNIPVNETIDIICNKLYCTNPKLRPFIPEHYFRQLLDFATKLTHFLFNNKYYDQCDGVSMGTPLAAIFAEVFMAHFEETYLPILLNCENPKLLAWRRYVDDTFVIAKMDVDKEKIQQTLNSFQPCIQFTVQPETNATIAFLDVLVKRHENGFDTTVYRKKTSTKLMLKWHSLVPRAHKTASIAPLVTRAIRICSTFQLLHNEFEYIRLMAAYNDYPVRFVDQIIQKQLNKYFQSQTQVNQNKQIPTEKKKYTYIEIPYVGRASYDFGKRLKSTITTTDPTSHLRVIYKTTNPTKRFFPTKDRLTVNQKSGVVYEIYCNDCTKTYIGKTIRQTARRLNEHEKDAQKAALSLQQLFSHNKASAQNNKTQKNILTGRITKITATENLRRSKRIAEKQRKQLSQQEKATTESIQYTPNSALGKHVKKTAHSINFRNVQILTQDQRPYRLLIQESIQIRKKTPTLNATDTSVPLYVFPEGSNTYSNQSTHKSNLAQNSILH
ncbi:unnamed protein product [Rotaria sp. Silwood2]|nr:unnamed protein product [Rotaria sp. Silwood2]